VLVADMVLPGALVWTLIWLYQPLLTRVGVAQSWFGGVHALLCVAQIAVLRSIGRLTPAAGGRARYLRLAAGLPALAMIGLVWPLPPAATLALLLVAMGVGLSRTPIASAAINAAVDAEARATLLSTVSMLRTLAICLVNPIAGRLADRSLGQAMGALGLATLAVAVLSLTPLQGFLVGATVEEAGFDEGSTVAGVHALTSAVIVTMLLPGRAKGAKATSKPFCQAVGGRDTGDLNASERSGLALAVVVLMSAMFSLRTLCAGSLTRSCRQP
jgi:hypothetical protein